MQECKDAWKYKFTQIPFVSINKEQIFSSSCTGGMRGQMVGMGGARLIATLRDTE